MAEVDMLQRLGDVLAGRVSKAAQRQHLLALVAAGAMTPEQAIDQASSLGLDPLVPPPPSFDDPTMDPRQVAKWNLGMAIAWIGKRDLRAVQVCWGRFVRYRWAPVGRGMQMEITPPLTAVRLLLDRTLGFTDEAYAAGMELLQALADGHLEAVAQHLEQNVVVTIGKNDWHQLLLSYRCDGADNFADLLRFEGQKPHLRNAMVDWRALLDIWPPKDEGSTTDAALPLRVSISRNPRAGGKGNIEAKRTEAAATAWLLEEYMNKSPGEQTHTKDDLWPIAKAKYPGLTNRGWVRRAWRNASKDFPAWQGGTPPKRK